MPLEECEAQQRDGMNEKCSAPSFSKYNRKYSILRTQIKIEKNEWENTHKKPRRLLEKRLSVKLTRL